MSIILYGILGILLAFAGVSIIQQTLYFVAIMATVIAIDLISSKR